MVRKIIWSPTAKTQLKGILKYWIDRNKSTTYSKKLNHLFKEAINIISKNPGIGHVTSKENVKVKIVRDYLIVYQLAPDSIDILAIFDGRRNPEEIEKGFTTK